MILKSFVFVLFIYLAAADVSEFHDSGHFPGNATLRWNHGNGNHGNGSRGNGNHGNGRRGNLQNSPPAAPQCVTPQGPCACQTNQGLVDLSPIDSKDGTKPHFDNIQSSSGTFFKYNPCTDINTDICKSAAICACYSQWYCFVIGVHSSAQFKTDATTQRLTISYTAGTFYESVVTLVCDKAQEGTLTVDSSNTSPYKFTLTSKYACPSKSGGGGSGGSISVGTVLIIVFICLVFVYLVGGILFMHFVRGAEGIEKIPNIGFWREVPGLIKDGGVCVYQSVRCGSGGFSSKYEQI